MAAGSAPRIPACMADLDHLCGGIPYCLRSCPYAPVPESQYPDYLRPYHPTGLPLRTPPHLAPCHQQSPHVRLETHAVGLCSPDVLEEPGAPRLSAPFRAHTPRRRADCARSPRKADGHGTPQPFSFPHLHIARPSPHRPSPHWGRQVSPQRGLRPCSHTPHRARTAPLGPRSPLFRPVLVVWHPGAHRLPLHPTLGPRHPRPAIRRAALERRPR